jgi:hypothetical protein
VVGVKLISKAIQRFPRLAESAEEHLNTVRAALGAWAFTLIAISGKKKCLAA